MVRGRRFDSRLGHYEGVINTLVGLQPDKNILLISVTNHQGQLSFRFLEGGKSSMTLSSWD